MGDTSENPLRQALQEVILNLLSPEPNARQLAEQQILALQVTDDYGVYLTELTLQPNGSPPVRQMAAVMLKKYVDIHWCSDAEKFQPPETTPQAKATIRELLPFGLKESLSKIRSSVAYTIATIAQWDFPDEWPTLFDILMMLLKDPDQFTVQGAVRVLKEFTRDLTDTQIPQVAPVILPDMYRIFMEREVYDVRTRSRAIEIFTTLANMICTIGETNHSITKSLLNPVLPTFTEALVDSLNLPNESHLTDAGLKTEVLKALTVLVNNAPKAMLPWLGQILPPVWSTLTSSAEKYVNEVVNSDEDEGGNLEEVVDSDGEVLGLENLVFAIFEFVHAIVDAPKFRSAVKTGLADLMYYIVLYMQITDSQFEKWSENPEQFVTDEDEDSFSYSVRISSQDLLMALCQEFEEECCISLAQTVQRHLAESAQSKQMGKPRWWKIHEACMTALGSVQEVVDRQIKSGNVNFDMAGFLTNVVLEDVANPASPFLLGRSLWIGSKFPDQLNPGSLSTFLEATVSALQPNQMPIVRVVTARAIWGFFNHLKTKKKSSNIDLGPILPAALDGLVNMCTSFNSSSEIVGLVLENICVVVNYDAEFTAANESKVTPLAIAVFIKFSSDPSIVSLSEDIFKVLAQNPKCLSVLESRLIPTLMSILEGRNSQENSPLGGLQPSALDILEKVVRASGISQGKNNLSELMMNSAFPAVVTCVLHSDDSAILQSGGECLRAYVSVAPDQICLFTDSEGKSGLWYLVQVAGHLLNPVGSEFTATFVGRLVTTLIQNTSERLGENLDLLLKAVLSKLQGSETLSVMQSLLMVYAQLIHTQLAAVLNFLSSVPGPSGEPALHFVMNEWVSRQQVFYGAYEIKVFIVALSKVLQHGVVSGDPRLTQIIVNGDQIIQQVNTRTRSQTKLNPDKFTRIPLLAKILKLLICEMSNVDTLEYSDDDDDNEDTDSDGQIEENGFEGKKMAQGILLSDLLGKVRQNGEIGADDDDCDDPDAKLDPVYSLNLKDYLTGFVTELCQHPMFMSHFAPHLNTIERNTLVSAGIQA